MASNGNSPSDVLFHMGTRLGRTEPLEVPANLLPVVVCKRCSTRYEGDAVQRTHCDKCNANLLMTGTYKNGACPYETDCSIPYGKCHCGCGSDTGTYAKTELFDGNIARTRYRGAKARYVHGHNSAGRGETRDPGAEPGIFLLRRTLQAKPGVTFRRADLIRELNMSGKQISTAMSRIKSMDPNFQGDQGVYVYKPTPNRAMPAPTAEPTHRERVLAFLRSHPEEKFTRNQIAGVIGLNPQQVSNAMTAGKHSKGMNADGVGNFWYSEAPATTRITPVGGQRFAPVGSAPQKTLSRQAQALLGALRKAANAQGIVTISAWAAVQEAGVAKTFPGTRYRKSETLVRAALTELHVAGLVDASQNRVKRILNFVPEVPEVPDEASTGNGRGRVVFTPEEVALWAESGDVVEPDPAPVADAGGDSLAVDDKALADAIARSMWERYDWALAEVGRLQEANAVQVRQIERLQSIIEAMPVETVKDVARRFLADAQQTLTNAAAD